MCFKENPFYLQATEGRGRVALMYHGLECRTAAILHRDVRLGGMSVRESVGGGRWGGMIYRESRSIVQETR